MPKLIAVNGFGWLIPDLDRPSEVRKAIGIVRHPQAQIELATLGYDPRYGARGGMTAVVHATLDANEAEWLGETAPEQEQDTLIATFARSITGETDTEAVIRSVAAHFVRTPADLLTVLSSSQGRPIRQEIASVLGFVEAPPPPWVKVGVWCFDPTPRIGPAFRRIAQVEANGVRLAEGGSLGDEMPYGLVATYLLPIVKAPSLSKLHAHLSKSFHIETEAFFARAEDTLFAIASETGCEWVCEGTLLHRLEADIVRDRRSYHTEATLPSISRQRTPSLETDWDDGFARSGERPPR